MLKSMASIVANLLGRTPILNEAHDVQKFRNNSTNVAVFAVASSTTIQTNMLVTIKCHQWNEQYKQP